ncbi:hypothetical protein M5689_005882 [Euphorbia peplus]|nr:hypothetical protein M5689_005882 [Euphorbia peplus]
MALAAELVNPTPKSSIIYGSYSKEESEKGQTFEIEAKTKAQLLAEDQQQKTVMVCEDAQVRVESTSEVKLESRSEMLEEVASYFDATENSMETLIPEVELPIELRI